MGLIDQLEFLYSGSAAVLNVRHICESLYGGQGEVDYKWDGKFSNQIEQLKGS